jgi:AbrB family looped-hinge helix DNA binding protein
MNTERVKINDQGRIVIPAGMRQELGLAGGDTLVLSIENGELRAVTPDKLLRDTQELLAPFRPGPGEMSVSDELIAERRREAARELEEDGHAASA